MHKISLTEPQLKTLYAALSKLSAAERASVGDPSDWTEETQQRVDALDAVLATLKEQAAIKFCPQCGGKFVSTNPRQQTCSVRCRVARHRGTPVSDGKQ